MSFGAELVAQVLGLPDIPVRIVRKVIAGFIVVMALSMPITFGHGIELYAQREAAQITARFLDPMLKAIQPQSTDSTPARRAQPDRSTAGAPRRG